jgi:hypothetical protein
MKRGRQPDAKGRPAKRPAKARAPARRRSVGVGLAPELKFNDVAFVTDATTTGAVVALNQMAAGDTALLRDGNKIRMKSIQLRFTLQNESVTVNNIVRMMIVLDRQPNAANPTIATAGTGPLDTITIQSLRQVATVSRFKVLWEGIYTLNNENDTATCLKIVHDEVFIPIKDKDQLTVFADGASGPPINGGLYLMYFGNTAAGVTDVDVLGQARLRFWG